MPVHVRLFPLLPSDFKAPQIKNFFMCRRRFVQIRLEEIQLMTMALTLAAWLTVLADAVAMKFHLADVPSRTPNFTLAAVPTLSPNSKFTYTVLDGDTCASIAYGIRTKQGTAVYMTRKGGALCGSEDTLNAGETITLQTNALQGLIGSYFNGLKPPQLTTISKYYNQLVVAGATDKAGGGKYTTTGGIDKMLVELGPWKDAYPGTRQILLQVENIKKSTGQSDVDWATAAYDSLVAISNTHGCDGFVFTQLDGSGPCLLYTSPSPRDLSTSRMPSSA